jgi:hypothetical protein
MKPPIQEIVKITNRLQLYAPEWYYDALNKAPEIIDNLTNGVGSETHWSYHLIPDTNWFLNMCPVSHPHDMMYSMPLEFNSVVEGLAWKRLADYWFELNGIILIDSACSWLNRPRKSRLNKYIIGLNIGGSEAFWANKILPPDYDNYYSNKPKFNEETYSFYKKAWLEICSLKARKK